jgi:hypothetical protein
MRKMGNGWEMVEGNEGKKEKEMERKWTPTRQKIVKIVERLWTPQNQCPRINGAEEENNRCPRLAKIGPKID